MWERSKNGAAMQINSLEKFTNLYGRIDAILIVNKENIIEYSAMVTEDKEYLRTDDILGKNLFAVYPELSESNSTHAKVMATGLPVLNQKQNLTEPSGRRHTTMTSTFPIENNGELIGSIDLSVELPDAADDISQKRSLHTADDIVTQNPDMEYMKEKLLKIAKNDSPVMVIGESGTGKELIVEAIHSHGRRKKKPFISLNCAAIPDALIESTLFGTVKGSFTGAENKKGLFELANGGTLFLDEVNSMSLELQAKLLKAVEEQRYMKIGAESYTEVDVRLISAMNISPAEAVESGKMRQDLFYRLSVVQLFVPPLRKRKEDIPLLISYFIGQYNKQMRKSIEGISSFAEKVLQDYGWPGNVRELRNVMESAFNLVEGDVIGLTDLPDYLISESGMLGETSSAELSGSLAEMMNRYEKEILEKTLKNASSLNQAAAKLKITRQALKYKIEKLQIDYQALLAR
ncbi:MAG: sigma 54-interacting transcriptional regulator [Emergencia sp.]|nr:sigma 54-interacting transcriptional regulator [Emergencia sp.]